MSFPNQSGTPVQGSQPPQQYSPSSAQTAGSLGQNTVQPLTPQGQSDLSQSVPPSPQNHPSYGLQQPSQSAGQVVDARSGAQQTQGGNSCWSTIRWIGVALTLTATVVGVLGALVYAGQLGVSWQGVGALTQTMGLYGALGGLGTATVITILLTVTCCISNAKKNAEQERTLQQQQQFVPQGQPQGQTV